MKHIPKNPPTGGTGWTRALQFASFGTLAVTVQTLAAPIDMGTATTYTQNFDTLPSTGNATANAWANDSTLPGWYAEQSKNTPAPPALIVVNAGASTGGALYSYGAAAATERALGSLGSGTPGNFAYGVLLFNSNASPQLINSLAYTGEQWRNGGKTTSEKLSLSYKIDPAAIISPAATALVPAGWTAITAGDFTSPINVTGGATLDGNAAANRTAISINPNIVVPAGQYVFLRWYDPDDTGADHGMAMDEFSVGWTVAANPSLTITASATSFSESAANPASTGTVTIPAALGSNLTVALSSSDTTEATVPPTVTILAGATSANFDITAVDDFLADGTQSVTITGTAAGYNNGQLGLSVTNDTDAALAISFSQDPIVENAGPNASIGTVTLAAPTVSALTVNLTSSDTTEATVPASIVIPAGEASGTFPIDAVNDTEVDGTKTSVITASATGYTTGTKFLTIQDDGDTVPPPTIPVDGIAFTGFNADANDDLAFVALVAIAGGDTILFTDNEWNGGVVGETGAFTTGEGVITWTAPEGGVPAGTIVQLNQLTVAGRTASVGTLSASGSFNLGGSDETVYAFQGTVTGPTRFLAVISTTAADSIVNTGVTSYVLLPTGVDIAAYTGSRGSESTYAGYIALINDAGNWVTQDATGDQSADGTAPDVPFSSTAFTLASAGNTFASWVAANVTPPQPAGFTADHDSDGVRNGVEYFMGATGSSFTAMPAPVTVGGISSVSYPRDATATGVTYKVQTSPDLVIWTDIAPGDPNLDTSNPAIVKYTLPTGSGKLFTRLDVITSTP